MFVRNLARSDKHPDGWASELAATAAQLGTPPPSIGALPEAIKSDSKEWMRAAGFSLA